MSFAWQSKRAAKIVIGCIWLLALALAFPMALALQVEMVEETDFDTQMMYKKPFCIPSKFTDLDMTIYRLILFFLQYLTPLCVISCVYARMAFELWGSRAPGNAQTSRDASLMKNKKKVIKMLVIVVVLFALCWMPLQTYQVLQMCFPSINEYRYINIIFFCFDWLAMSNSCYNPFIYGIYNEKFKREFRQRFRFCRRSKHNLASTKSIDLDRNHTSMARYSSFRLTCESRLNSSRKTSATPKDCDRGGSVRNVEFRNNNNGGVDKTNAKQRNSLPENIVQYTFKDIEKLNGSLNPTIDNNFTGTQNRLSYVIKTNNYEASLDNDNENLCVLRFQKTPASFLSDIDEQSL